MLELKKIVVPTDFSPHARKAVELATRLATELKAELHLLHVLHMPITIAVPGEPIMPPNVWSDVRDSAQEQVRAEAERITVPGVDVTCSVLEGVVSDAILQCAEDVGADLIVMGTRGLSGLRHVVMGSVAERVVRGADCPVLTTKDGDAEGVEHAA